MSEVTLAEVAQAALEAFQGGEPVASVVVVAMVGGAAAPEAVRVGRRLLVWAEHTAGTLGEAALDAAVTEWVREALATAGEDVGTRTVEGGGASWTLYFEVFRTPPELVIVGAGHIARPLCRLGEMLGFAVTVLDDRPEFATRERFPEAARVLRADFADPLREVRLGPSTHLVLVTRGHKYDYDVLRDVLRRPVELAYVGMVGSQRRVRAALQELASEGIDRKHLLRIQAPIGLDIGAETPEEIAVAIVAEIIRLRRGGTGVSLRDRARVVERWIENRDAEP